MTWCVLKFSFFSLRKICMTCKKDVNISCTISFSNCKDNTFYKSIGQLLDFLWWDKISWKILCTYINYVEKLYLSKAKIILILSCQTKHFCPECSATVTGFCNISTKKMSACSGDWKSFQSCCFGQSVLVLVLVLVVRMVRTEPYNASVPFWDLAAHPRGMHPSTQSSWG